MLCSEGELSWSFFFCLSLKGKSRHISERNGVVSTKYSVLPEIETTLMGQEVHLNYLQKDFVSLTKVRVNLHGVY